MKAIVDYLIVIPLDEEFGYVRDVVKRLFKGSVSSVITIGAELYVRVLLPTPPAGAVSIVILSVGRMTEAPVQSAIEAAARTWRPAAIVMIGIAGSLKPDKVKLGDVFVPSKVFGYTEAKAEVISGKTVMTYRHTGDRLDCQLLAQARAVNLDHGKAWRAKSRNAGLKDVKLKPKLLSSKDGPKIHITDNDCLASGNVVVASREFAEGIQAALGTTVGAVEMEAKGLCEALSKIKPEPPALVARGISDLADEQKAALEKDSKDGWRRYAAQNAARFVLELIVRRAAIEEGYSPLAQPVYPMIPLPDSAVRALQMRFQAREPGVRNIAFCPLFNCKHGLPTTDLALAARRSDGSAAPFADFLLRDADDKRVLMRLQNAPDPKYRMERTGEPPRIELLVGLPADAVQVVVSANDEFGRKTAAAWCG